MISIAVNTAVSFWHCWIIYVSKFDFWYYLEGLLKFISFLWFFIIVIIIWIMNRDQLLPGFLCVHFYCQVHGILQYPGRSFPGRISFSIFAFKSMSRGVGFVIGLFLFHYKLFSISVFYSQIATSSHEIYSITLTKEDNRSSEFQPEANAPWC